MSRNAKTRLEKLLDSCDHADPDDDVCWPWTGSYTLSGTPMVGVWLGKRQHTTMTARRAMWEEFYGPIPDGLAVTVDWDDPDRKRCVNPDHLILATFSEIQQHRGPSIPKVRATHCVHGHEWNEENTGLAWTAGKTRQYRVCRACRRERELRRRWG